MMVRILLLSLLFAFAPWHVWGQSWGDEGSEASFVQIYMESKKSSHQTEKIIERLLSDYGISPDRYKQLMQLAATGKHLQLSAEETAFSVAITQQEQLVREQQSVTIDSLCTYYGMLPATYSQLLHKYKSSVQYQRTLHPYFQAYIKAQE